MRSPRRYTREVLTNLDAKIAIKIEAEDNQNVVLVDEALGYAITLDPRAALETGRWLSEAARIAAMNILLDSPPPKGTTEQCLRSLPISGIGSKC